MRMLVHVTWYLCWPMAHMSNKSKVEGRRHGWVLTLSAKMKTVEFANSIEAHEVALYQLPHLDLHGLSLIFEFSV